MKTVSLNHTKQWLKNSQNPFAKRLLSLLKALLYFQFPAPRFLFSPAYFIYTALINLCANLTRIFFWTPLFKGRVTQVGSHFYLYGGLPYITGPLNISFGDNCRVSGQSTFTGRSCNPTTPYLSIANNVDIGWMTTIAVGSKVVIEDNVRIAGRALLAGYPGHPLDANDRAQGLPETEDQVGDIILEKDVWLATGVSVMAGVRIGAGSIIAAGSVVSKDIPPMVLAGGVPARVIRPLNSEEQSRSQEQN